MDGTPLADLLGTPGARPVATFGAGVVTLDEGARARAEGARRLQRLQTPAVK